MAEEKTEKNEQQEVKQQKPTLFIILIIVNMLVIVGIGLMLYMSKAKESKKPGIDDVIEAEHADASEAGKADDFIGKLIPLENFLVNLSGSRGRRLVRISLELEVNNEDVQEEIDKIKPKIRDRIILILSSNTYAQISSKEGKVRLRDEIKDKVNLFLVRGQIVNVYFTQLMYQ